MKGPRSDVSGLLSLCLRGPDLLTATLQYVNEEHGPALPTPPPPRERLPHVAFPRAPPYVTIQEKGTVPFFEGLRARTSHTLASADRGPFFGEFVDCAFGGDHSELHEVACSLVPLCLWLCR